MDRALQFADSLKVRDRHWVRGVAALLRHSDKEAVAEMQAVWQVDPTDIWAADVLSGIYEHEGIIDEALPYIAKMADLQPDSVDANYYAWDRLSRWSMSPEAAQPYLERLKALGTQQIVAANRGY